MTQTERVVKRLLEHGVITRNQCLYNRISRLSAIIQDLEEEGWEFEADFTEDRTDYYYKLIKSPYKKVMYMAGDIKIEKYEHA